MNTKDRAETTVTRPPRTERVKGSTAAATRPLLDIAGVAERLGVSIRHVRRLVHEQRIPFLKWGHLLRFDPDEVERWLDNTRRPAREDL